MLQNAKVLVNLTFSRHLLLKSTSPVCSNGLLLRSAGTEAGEPRPKEKVSKAMKAYLERAKAHDEFMRQQQTEFQIGKRHLANMMGVDPDTMTQPDIDRAIEFLFPSGLFESRARPQMRPPEMVFPQRKAAEFDESGRPHHFLFYTMSANFYQLMHDTVTQIEALDREEDVILRKRGQTDPDLRLDVSGSEWVPKEVLEKMLVERVSEPQYAQFQAVLSRLLEHPLSSRARDFVKQYRKPLLSQNKAHEIPKPSYDSDGLAYVTVKECLRKQARGEVTVRMPGCGKFTVNGQDVSYFERTQDREQLLFPLLFTALIGRVDVEATVAGGGTSGQAGAVRWGLSWALRSFVDSAMVERMRLAGLLTRDYRRRERKKPGQAGARKKFTWKKR